MPDKKFVPAFDLYASWGIKGVKIDFMDRDDQEMIGFFHRVMEDGDEAQVARLFTTHSAYHPTGMNQTLPNHITQ